MTVIQQIAILAPPFLFALTIHEFSHGYVADRLGDPTARNMGRLTLNPIKHIDPLGVLAFIIMKIGWAKPVPVNPHRFTRKLKPKHGMLLVAAAGPLSNIAMALTTTLLLYVYHSIFVIKSNDDIFLIG